MLERKNKFMNLDFFLCVGSVQNVTRQEAVTWKQTWPWKPYQMGPNDQGGRLRNQ